MTVVAVLLAGALGAGARFVVDHAVGHLTARRSLPVGTLTVNVSGSAVAGVLAGLVVHHGAGEAVRLMLGTGFLAAFTTYSAFAVETVRLIEERAPAAAIGNVVASLVLSTGAAAAGLALASY